MMRVHSGKKPEDQCVYKFPYFTCFCLFQRFAWRRRINRKVVDVVVVERLLNKLNPEQILFRHPLEQLQQMLNQSPQRQLMLNQSRQRQQMLNQSLQRLLLVVVEGAETLEKQMSKFLVCFKLILEQQSLKQQERVENK